MSIRELEGLLSLLEEKKRKMEQQESEASMEIMLGFLHCLRRQKLEELSEVENWYMTEFCDGAFSFVY